MFINTMEEHDLSETRVNITHTLAEFFDIDPFEKYLVNDLFEKLLAYCNKYNLLRYNSTKVYINYNNEPDGGLASLFGYYSSDTYLIDLEQLKFELAANHLFMSKHEYIKFVGEEKYNQHLQYIKVLKEDRKEEDKHNQELPKTDFPKNIMSAIEEAQIWNRTNCTVECSSLISQSDIDNAISKLKKAKIYSKACNSYTLPGAILHIWWNSHQEPGTFVGC